MVFSIGAYDVGMPNPQYGYTCSLTMNIHRQQLSNGQYGFFDCGTAYDHRQCTCTWLVESAVLTDFEAYIRGLYRGEHVDLALGATPTGFYPGGPDLGDKGDWVVQFIDADFGGWKMAPYGYHEVSVTMQIVTAPSYTLPSRLKEGSLQIGTVDNLRWPEGGFSPTSRMAFSHDVTRGGVPKITDLGYVADAYESEWTQSCNQGNACALASYIANTGRSNQITIVAPQKSYIFGSLYQTLGAGTYQARAIHGGSSQLVTEWTHADWDYWTVPLKYWMVSAA